MVDSNIPLFDKSFNQLSMLPLISEFSRVAKRECAIVVTECNAIRLTYEVELFNIVRGCD